MRQINNPVFYPPFILLVFAALISFFFPDRFINTTSQINQFILEHFSWLFSWSTFFFLLLVWAIFFHPKSKQKIGGSEAKPLLKKWQWFSITLCTTIATGILFWGTAEPIYHLIEAPKTSASKEVFAMSTMFMHWSFTPYAIYTLGGLTFAYCHYSLKQPFRVSTLLYPLLKNKAYGNLGNVVDALCLFSLVAGMAASLGAGILAISGGLNHGFQITASPISFGCIMLFLVLTFVLSSISGLQKGIKFLSSWNIVLFIVFALFFFVFGPTWHIVESLVSGVSDYALHFLPRSLGLDGAISEEWSQSWTVFYWANWLAWTPVTAVFLGRLGRGYSIRSFILINLVFPALFSILWMSIFSGSSIYFDQMLNGGLQSILTSGGAQAVMYGLLEMLPLAKLSPLIFLIIVFISYVTAADSNTSAMAGISSTLNLTDGKEAPKSLKLTWGIMVGLIAWIMVSFAGIEGIKMTSNLGGFPALLLLIAVAIGTIKWLFAKT